MTSIVQELQQHFQLCDLGLTFFLLSVQIKQDLKAHFISLLQSHYINELLKYFGIEKCNSIKTPLVKVKSSGLFLFLFLFLFYF